VPFRAVWATCVVPGRRGEWEPADGVGRPSGMSKGTALLVAAGVLLGGVAACSDDDSGGSAAAADVALFQGGQTTTTRQQPNLSNAGIAVSGKGEVEGRPDSLQIEVGVSARRDSVAQATNDAAVEAQAVIDAL